MIEYTKDGLNFQLDTKNFTAKIIQSKKANGDIFIPRSINYDSHEYIITTISEKSFFFNYSIKQITFSKDSQISMILNEAFVGSLITNLSIPDSLTEISEEGLSGCHKLLKIEFSENSNLRVISKSAFSNSAIESIKIPKHVVQIGERAFNYCINLKTVEFYDDSELVSIEKEAFISSEITKISIPKSTKKIGESAFENCGFLNEVEFSKDSQICAIENGAFSNSALVNFTFPKHVKTISKNCFFDCKKLKTINFSEDSELQSIESYAFNGSSIENLSIPANLIELRERWCIRTSFLNFQISPKNRLFAFINGQMLVKKSDENKDVYDELYFVRRDVENIEIPSFIKTIKSCSLSDCKRLKTVTFSEDSELISIENDSFFQSSIESLFIPEKVVELNDLWCSSTNNLNVISISPKNERFLYFQNQMIIGKDDIKHRIYKNIVFVRRDIENVNVPSYIEKIKPFSFCHCQQIKSITFPENSELCLIDKFAFFLSRIEEISIPSHVTEICESAFDSCILKKIDFTSNSELKLIGKNAFQNSKIKRIIIPRHVSIISEYSFYYTLCLKKIEFSNNSELKIIKEKAFFLSGIESISIPDHVKQINEFAFGHCRSLKRIHFGEKSEICSIGEGAFSFSVVEKIEIPKMVKKIEKESFQFCDNLKCVEFLGDVIYIDDCCFDNCKNLLIISFPNAFKLTVCLHSFQLENIANKTALFVQPYLQIFVNEQRK